MLGLGLPRISYAGPYNPLAPAPSDGREYYDGTFQTGVDARTEAGNANNVSGGGPTIWGAQGGYHQGPVPLGGWSQLGGRTNESNNGFWGGPAGIPFQGGEINGRPLSGPNGPMGLPQWHGAQGQMVGGRPQVFTDPAPVAAPRAPEPGRAPAQMWAGGFGLSDGSAWGNKGDAAQMSRSGVNGSLKEMPGQSMNAASGGFQNGMLPGAGSVFGLGGAR